MTRSTRTPLHASRINGLKLAALTLGVVILASCSSAPPESVGESKSAVTTGSNLYFNGGGPMRNFIVDLVFWGDFTETQRLDERGYVTSYLKDFSTFVSGGFSPPGKDPAVRYYGLWGITLGNWINDPNPIPSRAVWGNPTMLGDLSEDDIQAQAAAASSGQFGPSYDAWGNPDSAGLPFGPGHLRMVITKGAATYDSGSAGGFHFSDSWGPVGAAMYDWAGQGSTSFPTPLSHEIQEAMTDTTPFSGWVSNDPCYLGICGHQEGCDYCGGDNYFTNWLWSSEANRYLSTPINQLVLNPSFANESPAIPADSCELWEPEQYAPMAATYEYQGYLHLVYRDPSGIIHELSWAPGQSATGPYIIGVPSATVAAGGKPSVVYTLSGGGEYIFVRGATDNTLYMYNNGKWTGLGGISMFGDPSAVVSNGGQNINVFVLGIDDNIYTYGIANGVPQGWYFTVPGAAMSGPPKAISKSASTIDVFAVGENGHLEWMPWSTSTGWSLTDLGTMNGSPHHTPVGIASWASNRLDIFTTTETSVAHRAWSGSWQNNPTYDVRPELGTAPSGSPAVVSWGPGRLDAFVINRQHQLLHVVWSNNAWVNDPMNPMATNAVGDPIVMSRGTALLDVFYRTTNGTLTHLVFNNGWSTENVSIYIQ